MPNSGLDMMYVVIMLKLYNSEQEMYLLDTINCGCCELLYVQQTIVNIESVSFVVSFLSWWCETIGGRFEGNLEGSGRIPQPQPPGTGA